MWVLSEPPKFENTNVSYMIHRVKVHLKSKILILTTSSDISDIYKSLDSFSYYKVSFHNVTLNYDLEHRYSSMPHMSFSKI